jgi:hypothetical protein
MTASCLTQAPFSPSLLLAALRPERDSACMILRTGNIYSWPYRTPKIQPTIYNFPANFISCRFFA